MSLPLATIERPVPYSVEAEEAVLGSMLMDPDAITKVVSFLKADDFYREKHAWVFEALLNLNERDEPVDTLTVSDELERMGRLSDIGGAAALTELFLRVPTAIHVEYYGRIVERNAILRKLIGAAEGIAKLAYQETDADIAEIMDRAEAMLFAISQRRLTGAMIPIKEALAEFYEQIEHLYIDRRAVGLQTAYLDLDHILGGFQRGDLIILAARPAMGKTALSLGLMEQVALKHSARVAYFSLEMGVDQLVARMVSSQTGIDVQRLRVGPIYEDDLERIGLAVDVLGRTKIFIDETPSISPLELRTKARRVASEHGLDLIVVDYLQLMRGGGKNENRVQEISFISRALKGLARELRVPVLALSQLSRSVESRQEKRPMLSDLRESGCLAGETLIPLADRGQSVPLRSLVGQQGFAVWALNPETAHLERAVVSHAFCTGHKPVWKLQTSTGHTIRATANHKFYTPEGWKRLDALTPGMQIACPEAPIVGVAERVRGLSALPAEAGIGLAYSLSRPLEKHLVSWAEIVSIQPDGVAEVFDLTVPGLHNFVANEIIVHNSIEQDADVVMFIYRDEVYNKNTDRPNIAEIIVAKHRNGPTGTVELRFTRENAKFGNLETIYDDDALGPPMTSDASLDDIVF